ncbi:LytR/AlgR family response regulator transcription factor [Bounagaea algeriensis]
MTENHGELRVLVVDDVAEAADELARLLADAPEVDSVSTATDPLAAIREIETSSFDAVFLDIAMPGLGGLELGSLLSRLTTPPVIVFVTAYAEHAVNAYGVGAIDYLLKPVRAERLATAVSKVRRMVRGTHVVEQESNPDPGEDLPVLEVECEGRTWYVRRDDVRFVEANGDYVRLRTPTGRHPVRMPISRLEQEWTRAHFLRVHRSYLIDLRAVRELRSDSAGSLLARTDVGDVPVSRRHARHLRQSLLHAAQNGLLESTS